MLELVRCSNCAAPLQPPVGANVANCTYCGFQTRILGQAAVTTAPTRLAEPVSIKAAADIFIPLIAVGAELPASCTETISTSRDQQEVLTVELFAGSETTTARALVSVALPLDQRTPRGVARAKLSLSVDSQGLLTLTAAELGTSNVIRRDGLQLATK